jgi:ABC-type bacteriocin/lantibiotic exporter with double-glycine peptidase domain
MRKLIRKHKTTITGVMNLVLILLGVVMMVNEQMSATDFIAYALAANTIAITVIGAFSKDGTLKKNADE